MHKIDDILHFWFGRVEETIVPSENRARIWFGEEPEMDQHMLDEFGDDLFKARQGDYTEWENNPRGRLALILLLDQFSRHVYRNTADAYCQDPHALRICEEGLLHDADHSLSLIERVFYYFPLLHAESIPQQEQSMQAYQVLVELAFAETQIIYDSFLKFANHHHSIINRFGRFPQRNAILGRISTPEELEYLREIDEA